MTPGSFKAVPYIPDLGHFAIDTFTTFVVSALLAIMINAEAQAFMAAALGDSRPDAKDRFHFNAFLHLDILGSICYLVAGFGWPRPIDIDPGKFKHPRLYTVLTRLAGPLANILLANITASVVFAVTFFDIAPQVFMMVLGVNVTTAIYNLIPLPPLAAYSLLGIWLPPESQGLKKILQFSGPFLIVAIFLIERITGVGIISPYLNPMVREGVRLIAGLPPNPGS
jgi:Zn-dependent protease